LLPGCLSAGASVPGDSAQADTTTIVPSPAPSRTVDTILFLPQAEVTPTSEVTNPADLEKHLTQQPTVALFKSMLVPGLGQIGNRRYVKAAVVAGLEGWLIGMAVHRGIQASDARDLYLSEENTSRRWTLFYEYDRVRKSRNKYLWFAGLTIFVSMFDAYVDAHLSGSPADKRNEKFSVDVLPDDGGGVAAVLSYRF
jgi:hypothetical protein